MTARATSADFIGSFLGEGKAGDVPFLELLEGSAYEGLGVCSQSLLRAMARSCGVALPIINRTFKRMPVTQV
jgi:hypothetical protein